MLRGDPKDHESLLLFLREGNYPGRLFFIRTIFGLEGVFKINKRCVGNKKIKTFMINKFMRLTLS